MLLHETIMGKKLIEQDIPQIAKQLSRIANSLEILVNKQEEFKEDKNDNLEYLKSVSMYDLKLSFRCTNTLKNKMRLFYEEFKEYQPKNITLYHLVLLEEEQLMNLRNFGLKSLTELKQELKKFNLYLGVKPDDIPKLSINRQ